MDERGWSDLMRDRMTERILRQIHESMDSSGFPLDTPGAVTAATAGGTQSWITLDSIREACERIGPRDEPIRCVRATVAEFLKGLESVGFERVGPRGISMYDPVCGLAWEEHGDHILVGTPAQLADVNEKGGAWIRRQIALAEGESIRPRFVLHGVNLLNMT